jgi:hypothetical protein
MPPCSKQEAGRIGYPVLIKASGRRWRQGHAHRRESRRLRRRARLVQARGGVLLRRRPRAGREIPGAPAPHRDPGLRRHARQLRLPLRARLLGAAPPPEGAGGGARARHAAGAPRRHGPGRRRGGQGGRLRRRRHGGVHRGAGREVLLHGDEHPPAGRASGHRDDHRPRPRRVAAARRFRRDRCRWRRSSSPSAATRWRRASMPRTRTRASCLRSAASSTSRRRPSRSTCASIPASSRATRSRLTTTR